MGQRGRHRPHRPFRPASPPSSLPWPLRACAWAAVLHCASRPDCPSIRALPRAGCPQGWPILAQAAQPRGRGRGPGSPPR
eukprot:3748340-Lingulodinium_polyedra.AAC.1